MREKNYTKRARRGSSHPFGAPTPRDEARLTRLVPQSDGTDFGSPVWCPKLPARNPAPCRAAPNAPAEARRAANFREPLAPVPLPLHLRPRTSQGEDGMTRGNNLTLVPFSPTSSQLELASPVSAG